MKNRNSHEAKSFIQGNTLFYFWDECNESTWRGWWLQCTDRGETILAHNAITTSAYPPAVGWFIDGAICEELEVVMSSQKNQEPAMMPGPSQQAAQESPVPPFPTPAAPAIYVSHRRSIQNINGITGRTRTKKKEVLPDNHKLVHPPSY